MGDLYYKANGYKYTMSGNKLKFNPVPELSLSGLDSYGKYEVELNTTSWAWQGSKQITTLQDEIDFTEYLNGENPATSGTNMRFGIRFAGSDPSNTGYGTYWCILYDFGEDAGFVLQ